MVRLNDEGGFQLTVTDDAIRDMLGLVRAILWEDEDGQQAILANADLGPLALVLATALANALIPRVTDDLDAAPSALTVGQRQHAEAILIEAITGLDDDQEPPR